MFTYEVVGDSVAITDYPDDAGGDLEIPVEIAGRPVRSVGRSAFVGCRELTSITIP